MVVGDDQDVFECKFYVLCKVIFNIVCVEMDVVDKGYYIVFLLSCIIVYKGMFFVYQLGVYYNDLCDLWFILVFVFVY